jgi:hypothetical protein
LICLGKWLLWILRTDLITIGGLFLFFKRSLKQEPRPTVLWKNRPGQPLQGAGRVATGCPHSSTINILKVDICSSHYWFSKTSIKGCLNTYKDYKVFHMLIYVWIYLKSMVSRDSPHNYCHYVCMSFYGIHYNNELFQAYLPYSSPYLATWKAKFYTYFSNTLSKYPPPLSLSLILSHTPSHTFWNLPF